MRFLSVPNDSAWSAVYPKKLIDDSLELLFG